MRAVAVTLDPRLRVCAVAVAIACGALPAGARAGSHEGSREAPPAPRAMSPALLPTPTSHAAVVAPARRPARDLADAALDPLRRVPTRHFAPAKRAPGPAPWALAARGDDPLARATAPGCASNDARPGGAPAPAPVGIRGPPAPAA